MTISRKRPKSCAEPLEGSAGVFKALGHPERLRVVRALAEGSRCVCELHEACPSDLSTLSKHLAVLKRAGVLTSERRGREIWYSLKLTCAADFLECLLREKSGCGCACLAAPTTSKKAKR